MINRILPADEGQQVSLKMQIQELVGLPLDQECPDDIVFAAVKALHHAVGVYQHAEAPQLTRAERAESTLSQIRQVLEKLKPLEGISRERPLSPKYSGDFNEALRNAYPELLALLGKE